ncbi:hypothetical protein BC826DRAFT_1111104 [Russula brevipes]|nr:hypothetical protein BC826DRAFT_1111104 [Russula brevipes]
MSLKLLQHKENVTINKEPKIITWSHILDQDMLDKLRMVALCLAEAATTHFRTSWQMRAYADAVKGQHGASNEWEEQFRNWYPLLDKNTAISKNTTITDDEGKIIAWLLLDLLSKRMQDLAINKTGHLSSALQPSESRKSTSWRTQPQFFMNPKMGNRFPPGAINLSPAWHEQAKDGLTDAVKPSVTLRGGSGVSKDTPESCQRWVKDSGRIAAIMSAVLSVVQPDLYALNRECLLRLSEREDLREFIAPWGFTFNAYL